MYILGTKSQVKYDFILNPTVSNKLVEDIALNKIKKQLNQKLILGTQTGVLINLTPVNQPVHRQGKISIQESFHHKFSSDHLCWETQELLYQLPAKKDKYND